MKVLLVDDEPAILRSVRRGLLRQGHSVSCADSAAAAMTMIEKEAPEVVITDFKMPGMTGIDLLSWVGTRYPGVRRVLMTGYADVGTSAAFEARGITFILKPCEMTAILQVCA